MQEAKRFSTALFGFERKAVLDYIFEQDKQDLNLKDRMKCPLNLKFLDLLKLFPYFHQKVESQVVDRFHRFLKVPKCLHFHKLDHNRLSFLNK